MKKIGKILFTFLFVLVGLYGAQDVKAASYEIRFDNSYYEYYMTGGNNKLYMDIVSGESEIITKAINHFYRGDIGSQIVDVVPFKFTVKDGENWDMNSDSATMYINIPKLFKMESDNGESIYIVRIKEDGTDVSTIAYDLKGEKSGGTYQIKSYDDIKSLVNPSSAASYGKVGEATNFSNNYAVLTTSAFNETGTTYYMLVTCKGDKTTEPTTEPTTKPTEPTTKPTEPTTKPTTKPTEPTTKPTEPTTKPTEPTTEPTNPKTADASSQLYVVIGVICLIGILGLGAKFVKASK